MLSSIPRVQRTKRELQPLFEAFYTEDFELLRRHTEPDPVARALVELAFAKVPGGHRHPATLSSFGDLGPPALGRRRGGGVLLCGHHLPTNP